jgi:pimeloyl-ACP methyl ester carboxylesterase
VAALRQDATARAEEEKDVTTFEAIEPRMLDLPQGTVEYREVGAGPPIVLLHGLLVAGSIWRDGRLVLTPCHAYENFLPPLFRPLQLLAHVPPLMSALLQSLRLRPLRLSPVAFGWIMRRPDDELVKSWVRATLASRGARRDAMKLLRGVSNRQTLEAAERLKTFERPVLIAWAPEDRFFKLRYAERLANDIPGARLELIDDALTFVPIDQPRRTAELIAAFVREPRAAVHGAA